MTLQLNHTQRLNLSALLGAQRANVGDMRMFWKLQDKLELTEAEKQAINLRMVRVQDTEMPAWDRDKTIPEQTFELSETEAARIQKIIDEWPTFVAASDRLWLEPLLAQLGSVSSNGAGG